VSDVLGAVIAGGRSTRYGSAKALATVNGQRVVDRAIAALRAITPQVVTIVNDPDLAQAIGLPSRPDAIPGAGALGGIHTALLWAHEAACRGILAVACDMPFLSQPLLQRILDVASAAGSTIDVVAPESGGPRQVEPLCAYYDVRCVSAIEAALRRGDQRVIAFHGDVRVARLPIDEVRTYGDPAIMFLNINTPAERTRAEQFARTMRA
jgi:molybdopterin-guanine dinucleotide biosynthesis protein A